LEDDPRKGQHFLVSNKGYFSKTLNSFQIGSVSQGQWIGEELLLLAQNEKQRQLKLQQEMM
jgi:hypothetical protein